MSKKSQKAAAAELTAPVVLKQDEKQIVYGPVLVPDEPDYDNDVVSAEKIEEVAHKFMLQYGNIDLMHSLNNVGKVVESYILPMDWQVNDELLIPKGTWMMGVKVLDDETWEMVKEGKLTGFSIMGVSKVTVKSKKGKEVTLKRTTLADLGDDWIVNAVSLVDEPAVPKAKWIAIKSKNKPDGEGQDGNEMQYAEKVMEGSFEALKWRIEQKIRSVFGEDNYHIMVYGTFDDHVIIKVYFLDQDIEKAYRIDYEIDENGEINLIGDPVEVLLQEMAIPVNENETVNQSEEPENNTLQLNASLNSKNESIFSKFLRKFGFRSEKVGRRFSEENYQKLKAAKEVLEELLRLAEEERADKTDEKSKKAKEGEDMDEKQIKELIKSEIEPLENKLNEITEILKSEGNEKKEEGVVKEEGKNKDDQTKPQEEDTVAKSEYDKLLAELEKVKKSAFSKRLSGQDDMSEKKKAIEKDRDPFGFKLKQNA
ncbi:MAG: structural protein [Caldibacillus debilis]|uniref:XkdF-like putative serine protease domain-containing protein n=1 Tax=Caldibacillus debilis TaxID=301148 RepID=UPI000E365428|nr:XkdF-like putative serine protease domain-containing protein [Caldibacillus debilis]REJ18650.1 MAG: structural protein [Caldibacillus debilis]